MLDALHFASALTGAALVAAGTAWADDDKRRRFIALGIATIAVLTTILHGETVTRVLATLALLVSGLGTFSWLRDHRPVRLTAEERRLHRLVFPTLGPAQVRRLIRAGELVDALADTTLLEAHKAPNRVLLLVHGEARVEIEGELQAVLAMGRFIGEMGWITNQPTSAQVIAGTDVHYVMWTRDGLDALFSRHPDIRALFNVAVAQNLAAKLRFTQL